MNLSDFISDQERRAQLAAACNTSGDWLYQIATNWNGRRASTDLAKLIERESERIGPEKVPKELLRPDVWGEEVKGADEEQNAAA
jgi:hypothetical protein